MFQLGYCGIEKYVYNVLEIIKLKIILDLNLYFICILFQIYFYYKLVFLVVYVFKIYVYYVFLWELVNFQYLFYFLGYCGF